MVAARTRASDHPLWLSLSFSRAKAEEEAREEEEEEEAPPASSLARRSQAASAEGSMPKRAQTSGATQLVKKFLSF